MTILARSASFTTSVIMPDFSPKWAQQFDFPWFLGMAPIDYQSRLEAELTRVWGGFEKHEVNNAVVGEVEGIEIHRSVTVYQRSPPA